MRKRGRERKEERGKDGEMLSVRTHTSQRKAVPIRRRVFIETTDFALLSRIWSPAQSVHGRTGLRGRCFYVIKSAVYVWEESSVEVCGGSR